jgi:hypothetical protein
MMKNRTVYSRWSLVGAVVLATLGLASPASLGAEKPPAEPPERWDFLGSDPALDPPLTDDPDSEIYIPRWRPPSLHTVQEDRVYDPPDDSRGDAGTFSLDSDGTDEIMGGGFSDFGWANGSMLFDLNRVRQNTEAAYLNPDWRAGLGAPIDADASFGLGISFDDAAWLAGEPSDLGAAGAYAIPAPPVVLALLGVSGLAGSRRRRG